jgi:iron complex transport system substrate-binding protein
MNKKKIVSFFPAATEVLYALEIDKLMMGRSHECTFPFETKFKRALSRPKWGVGNAGEDMDEIVSDLFNAAFSPYDIHHTAIKKMRPDVIITSSMYEDCGISKDELEALAKNELGYDVEVLDFHINTIEDMFDMIEVIGEVIEVQGRAKRYLKLLKNRIKHLSTIINELSAKHQVLFFEWLNPTLVTGGWIPDVISFVGANHVPTSAGDKAAELSFEDLISIDPEIIVLGAKENGLDEVMDEIGKMSDYGKWTNLQAVQNKRVYAVNSKDLFSVPGPRMIDAMEVFCDMLYPKTFLFGHKGKNFIPIRF